MSEWVEVKIEDVCEKIIDCEHKTAPIQNEGIPSIRTPNIGKGRLLLDGVNLVSEETWLEWTKRAIPQHNDLILAREAPLGNVAIIPPNMKLCLGQRTVLLRPDNTKTTSQFLCYLLLSPKIQYVMHSRGGGATVPHLNVQEIRNLPIPLPPLPIQQKIAAILSAYDDLIENNLKQIKLLEEMAQITYEEWFVRFKFPNHENTPVDGVTGLPLGWSEKVVTEIGFVNINSITVKTAPEKIKYIDISSAGTGFYSQPETLNFADAPSRARRKVNFGDTIFSTVRPNQRTYSLILEDDPILVASTGFAVVTPKITDTFSFVYLSVTSQNFVDRAVSVAGGAAYPAINQTDFEKIKIVIPNTELIKQFSEKTIHNFLVKSALTKQNQLLKEARDILLPRLMTGKIVV